MFLEAFRKKTNPARRKETDGAPSLHSTDDFRTSLQNANACLRRLGTLTHPSGPTSPKSPPAHISKGSSSTTSGMHSAATLDLNYQRLDALSRLVEILSRNVRVRYELDFGEVLHTYGRSCPHPSFFRRLIFFALASLPTLPTRFQRNVGLLLIEWLDTRLSMRNL